MNKLESLRAQSEAKTMANLGSKVLQFLLCMMLLLLVVESRCTHPRKYDSSGVEARFKAWLQSHGKHYKDHNEWMLRFGIYQANLNFIEYINSQDLSYKLGDNEFADLTNDEFKALYVGRLIIPRSSNGSHYTTPDPHQQQQAPPAIDWRLRGAVTDVKMQGECGSCWSFSAAGGVESAVQIKTGKLMSLSEQEIVDCDTNGDDKGCLGGFKEGAFQYIQDNGVTTDIVYPYTGKQGPCHAPATKAARISGFKTVAANSEASIMAAVALQPVSVSVESSGSEFQLYSSGIFQGRCGTDLDHDLIIVGYGEAEQGGLKYWILKNSWGTGWGEEGYMRILRGAAQPEGVCGLAMMPSYPVA